MSPHLLDILLHASPAEIPLSNWEKKNVSQTRVASESVNHSQVNLGKFMMVLRFTAFLPAR
jgi:hypothetical protein